MFSLLNTRHKLANLGLLYGSVLNCFGNFGSQFEKQGPMMGAMVHRVIELPGFLC